MPRHHWHDENGNYSAIRQITQCLRQGGIGGVFEHSTNYRHLTGDSNCPCSEYGIKLKHIDYIQIHPTTLYSEKEGREFLISESVRGEGAVLLNGKGERFVNELLPRDVVANAIFAEMKKEGSKHVWLSMAPIPEEEIRTHFPNIYQRCLDEGYDATKEPIPVVPSQHYFMGGIDVDRYSKTSMNRLYAAGDDCLQRCSRQKSTGKQLTAGKPGICKARRAPYYGRIHGTGNGKENHY